MNFDLTLTFTLPTRIFYGYSSVNMIGGEAKNLGMQKVLLVTDKGVRGAGVIAPALKSLEASGTKYEIFDDVPEDPNTQVVEKGLELLNQTGCNGVIIIGGGSPLCAGKGVALVATNGGNIRNYEGFERYKKPPLPVIAIPTTAGSGSEVSGVFLISDEQKDNHKMAVGGYYCHPNVAILDPLLLRSLPVRQFIISGIDALTHAIEATWTNHPTPLTDAIAYEAIQLIMKNLAVAAFTDDLEAESNQLFASAIAKIAFGNAKLGLVHVMAHPLESLHLSHGLAVGIPLAHIMEFNLPACEEKLARMAELIGATEPQMSLAEKAEAAVDAVKKFFRKVDFPDRLPEKIVPKSEIPRFVKAVMGLREVKFNLRKPKENDLTEIYERAYKGWRQDSLFEVLPI